MFISLLALYLVLPSSNPLFNPLKVSPFPAQCASRDTSYRHAYFQEGRYCVTRDYFPPARVTNWGKCLFTQRVLRLCEICSLVHCATPQICYSAADKKIGPFDHSHLSGSIFSSSDGLIAWKERWGRGFYLGSYFLCKQLPLFDTAGQKLPHSVFPRYQNSSPIEKIKQT